MLKNSLAVLAAVAALSLAPGCAMKEMRAAAGAPAPATSVNGMLMAPGGMTLYTFDKDSAGSGASACNGPCATLWPPLLAQPGDAPGGDYTLVTRADGGRQWAYKGWPLYLFSKDMKAGDAMGDNFKNIWHVARS